MKSEQKKSLSDLELNLLRYLAAREAMSVREVADGFGEEHGYARTTILTVMERLRKKQYVTRRKLQGVFVYTSSLSQTELMQSVIGKFVSKALGGSVSPLVAFLAEEQELTDVEIAKLRELVATSTKREETDDRLRAMVRRTRPCKLARRTSDRFRVARPATVQEK